MLKYISFVDGHTICPTNCNKSLDTEATNSGGTSQCWSHELKIAIIEIYKCDNIIPPLQYFTIKYLVKSLIKRRKIFIII